MNCNEVIKPKETTKTVMLGLLGCLNMSRQNEDQSWASLFPVSSTPRKSGDVSVKFPSKGSKIF